MSIALAAVRSKLLGDGDITSIVGQRVYPSVAPADARSPFMVINRTDDETPEHYGGQSEMRRHGFRIITVGPGRLEVDLAADAVRRVLDGVQREAATTDWGDITLRSIRVVGTESDWQQALDGEEEGHHEAAVDIMVSWKES
jgi:hypothetical protein